jgi:CHAT domain-containing protein
LAIVQVASMQGDFAGASVRLERLLEALTTRNDAESSLEWDLEGEIDARVLQVRMSNERGDFAAARKALEAAYSAFRGVANATQPEEQTDSVMEAILPHLAIRLRQAEGQIARATGDLVAAQAAFGRAVALLDQQRASLPLEEFRTAFLEDKTTFYSDLVLALLDRSDEPGTDEIAEAFSIVERARSRALLERLLLSVDADAVPTEDPDVVARREAARQQLYWLYNQLTGDSGARRLSGEWSKEVQRQESIVEQLEWRTGAALASVQPATVRELQEVLATDETAIVFYTAGDEVMAFLVQRESVRLIRRLCSLKTLLADYQEFRFQLGRVEIGSERRSPERLVHMLRMASHRLYELIFAPLGPYLRTFRLLLAPHGLLHLLPLHALWDGTGYLVERHEIAYMPSASIAVQCRHRRRGRDYQAFAGLAPADAHIPHSRQEVVAAAGHFAMGQIFLNEDATCMALQDVCSEVDVLHLATHGLFRGDNSMFSALQMADGWIDVREIYRLPLRADLVVLSACESGMGEVRGGDEVIGLSRGFLGAGAINMIVSLWNVHDASAVQLMEQFYTQLLAEDGQRPASALRLAQLQAVRNNQHPYYWASFTAIG